MMKTISITIDLETDWGGRQDARETNYGMEFALPSIKGLLDEHKTKATFFVCGDIMENYRDAVLELKEAGHEIQCHGYRHINFSRLPLQRIKEEIRKCVRLFSGFGIELSGFRAPQGRFNDNLFKALASLGFDYDSSVIRARIPGRFDNTGYPLEPFTAEKSGLKEIPVSPIPRLNLPLGLVWVNTMGFGVFKRLAGGLPEHAVFYMHPFDIVHPKPPFRAGFLQRGWYSFRQKNAEQTLKDMFKLFSGARKSRTLGEVAGSL
jgi:peptidoglycan/xylan/chitin deacetylase (PgdA/CDA1 family)